ncbi:hypothetical protein PT2222_230113 [Paraburkholderia tropica]
MGVGGVDRFDLDGHAFGFGAAQREARRADLHEQRVGAPGRACDHAHGLAGHEAQIAQTLGDGVRRGGVFYARDKGACAF